MVKIHHCPVCDLGEDKRKITLRLVPAEKLVCAQCNRAWSDGGGYLEPYFT